MTDLYERVAAERTRLRQVRQLLTAATEQGAHGAIAYVAFYVAIADYFEAAMERLHTQDIRLGKILSDKADMDDPQTQKAMRELDERLAGNQKHLRKMLAAREALRAQAELALPEFDEAGGAYAAFIVENMGPHPGTADLARDLFTGEDWGYMADVSEEDQQRERRLYEGVFALVPPGLQLPEE